MTNTQTTVKAKTNDTNELRLLTSLRDNLVASENSLWAAGRDINDLRDSYGWTTKELAKYFQQSRNRLDEIAATARAYPQGKRKPHLTFSAHEVARKAARRAAKGVAQHFGRAVEPNYTETLETVEKDVATKGKHAVRDAVKASITKERQRQEPQRRAMVAKLSKQNAKLLQQLHHMDCRALLPTIKPKTVKLIHLDPPYANYIKTEDGGLHKSSASSLVACDNDERTKARAATIEALRLSVPLLVPNGVICLWQAANVLPWEVGKVIEDLGLEVHPRIVWDKNNTVLGDPSMAVMFSCEDCYIITRKGEKPLSYIEGDRKQVIRYTRTHQSADAYEPRHLMEKPHLVNEEIVSRFTAEGDIIVDAFGCSASMSIAAEKLNRKWIYAESNAENHALGKRNMENYLLRKETKTA